MANISKECIDEAKLALKAFNSIDLEQYVVDVFTKAKEFKNLKGMSAIDQAIEAIGNERAQVYMEELQRQVNNKGKLDKLLAKIENEKKRLIDLVSRRHDNLGENIESSGNGARKLLNEASFNQFTADETAFIYNEKNAIEIMRAMDGKPSSDIAKAIAKKLEGYKETRTALEVNSGSLLLSHINKDRGFKATHDGAKLLRGGRNLVRSAISLQKYTVEQARDIWKSFIKSQINHEKTFAGTDAMNLDGTIDMAKADSMLDEIFQNIVAGKPYLIQHGTGRPQMFFYWKDNEAWLTYNQKYGRGSLVNALRADIQASANRIGLSDLFGSSPVSTYNALAERENKINPQSSTTKAAAKMAFNYYTGQDRAPVTPHLSSFFNALRGFSGAQKLAGRLTIVSLPDIANGISFAERAGAGYFESYGVYLTGLFNFLPTEERKFYAELFKDTVDAHQGYLNRFINAENAGDWINNFNNVMYRYTLMEAEDRGNKISAMVLMGRILGRNSKFAYHQLTDQGRKLLDKFNVTEAEWNGIRKNATKLGKRDILSIDAVDKLSDADLRAIYGVDTDRPLYQLKRGLYNKVYSMFDVASENAVLTPGVLMKSIGGMNVSSIPIVNEILKSIMQFKMYPLSFIDRVLWQGLKDSDGIQNKLKFAALLFGATLPMSYTSMYLDYHTRGRTMPSWDKMDFSERVNFSKDLLLPGLGLMGAFLDPNNQNPYKVGSFMSTPAIQLLYEGMVAPLQISEGFIEGDKKKVKKAFATLGKTVIPGQGLPFVSPYIRQMFGNKPYLQPGQQQLFGK